MYRPPTSSSGTSVKARHLRTRPAVSAAYIEGDDLGAYTHDAVEFLTADDPDFEPIEQHLVGVRTRRAAGLARRDPVAHA